MKKALLVLLLVVSLLTAAYALVSVTVHQPGKVRIINGTNPGLTVNPAVLDFGNVTMGHSANQTITLRNTGDCYEYLNVNGTTNGNITVPLIFPQPYTLKPGGSITVTAELTANMTATMPPGDYMFSFDWTATCY